MVMPSSASPSLIPALDGMLELMILNTVSNCGEYTYLKWTKCITAMALEARNQDVSYSGANNSSSCKG